MGKKSVIAVLAENLRALMAANPSLSSSPKMAKRSGVSARTVNNAGNARHDPKLSSVEAMAKSFGLEAYQLLVPSVEKKFLELCRAWNETDELGKELLVGAAETALRRAHGGAQRTRASDD